ncbi:MAG: excinuclease ABC subunit UvrB [Chitinophagales bacterium]|nr:excinuclease ABC subunit UvrB [Chitinophagales bacterium]MDW8393587.1 excinuclease ABC subunit UvrB [Chitinophagales bacterium]
MKFRLHAPFAPSGDQPEAISQLEEGLRRGERHQVLLGVTGSGKTFTIANLIERVQRPTLVLSHNKTLVAQLYGEFRSFFPENAVEYFVSYYDYYQPEAYLPATNTYIEKDLSINDEIEKLRLRTTTSLMSGRRDIIVVASVSCIYGIGNPSEYRRGIVRLSAGATLPRNTLLRALVDGLYSRAADGRTGSFQVRGDTVEVFPPYADYGFRIIYFGDVIEEIETFSRETGKKIGQVEHAAIFPANLYLAPREQFNEILYEIEEDLRRQVAFFEQSGKTTEAQRLRERVTMDLEMMRELGYCSGIENYSRYLDRRQPGMRPFCLLDYFPDDFLTIIDESHVTIPQLRGMYGGDRSRKQILVDYGFRLPAALDNRPLNFHEFNELIRQVIYVSATPGDYELSLTEGVFVEQVVRPTGLLDPPIEVRPSVNQIDDLLALIEARVGQGERVLVTTLTKRMAEELTKYLSRLNIRCRYIHAEVETLERVEILRDLRLGRFDVLIGVNLLREGLDLPEVSLVAILDADKEGFLRNERSLTQVAGRAARHVNGLVVMYADRITESMQRTINECARRREKQLRYNQEHGIVPQTVKRSREKILQQTAVLDIRSESLPAAEPEAEAAAVLADPVVAYMNRDQLQKAIQQARRNMEQAARDLEFLQAARYRDELFALEKLMAEKYGRR